MKLFNKLSVVDQARLDVEVCGTDGKLIRPVLLVLLAEYGVAEKMCRDNGPTFAVLPYSPTHKGAIERHFKELADAVASEIAKEP